MEYGIRILVLLLSQHFRYAHFIVYSYLKNLRCKIKKSDVSKKQFNARLTLFNVSLIFVLLCNTIQLKCKQNFINTKEQETIL